MSYHYMDSPRRNKAISIPSQLAKFMGPTWCPTGPCRPPWDGPHVGPMNFAIRDHTGTTVFILRRAPVCAACCVQCRSMITDIGMAVCNLWYGLMVRNWIFRSSELVNLLLDRSNQVWVWLCLIAMVTSPLRGEFTWSRMKKYLN